MSGIFPVHESQQWPAQRLAGSSDAHRFKLIAGLISEIIQPRLFVGARMSLPHLRTEYSNHSNTRCADVFCYKELCNGLPVPHQVCEYRRLEKGGEHSGAHLTFYDCCVGHISYCWRWRASPCNTPGIVFEIVLLPSDLPHSVYRITTVTTRDGLVAFPAQPCEPLIVGHGCAIRHDVHKLFYNIIVLLQSIAGIKYLSSIINILYSLNLIILCKIRI